MTLSGRLYFGLKKGLAITVLVGLNASSVPLVIRAFEAPQSADAAYSKYTINPQSGPVMDCPDIPGRSSCAEGWEGEGRKAPKLLLSGLNPGDIITVRNIQGNPRFSSEVRSSCRDGHMADRTAIPSLHAVAQFVDANGRVVDPKVPTINNRGAVLLRDMEGGIVIPEGAVKMYGSFPDDLYWDNYDNCTFEMEVAKAPKATFSIEKIAASPTVNPGGVAGYIVRVTNVSNVVAQNVLIKDRVPSGLVFDPSTSSAHCHLETDSIGQIVICGPNSMNIGEKHDHVLNFRVDSQISCGTTIMNQADVVADNGEENWGKTSVKVECPRGDLSFEKIGPAVINPGTDIGYIARVTNNSSTTIAQQVIVKDRIPSGLAFTPATSSAHCKQEGAYVVCGPNSMNPGETHDHVLNFRVDSQIQCGKTVTNDAEVTSSNSDSKKSKAVSTVECPRGGLTLEKIGPDTIKPGTDIGYIARVINNGPSVAQQVIVKDKIPSGLSFIPSTSSAHCSQQGQYIVCAPNSMMVGEKHDHVLNFRVDSQMQCGKTVTNEVEVTSTNSESKKAQSSAKVDCAPDLIVTKTAKSSSVKHGGIIKFDVKVTNIGGGNAQSVVLHDLIPASLDFSAENSDPSCSYGYSFGDRVVCAPFSLNAGQSKTITIGFRAKNFGQCGQTDQNVGFVFSSSPEDSNPTNNQSAPATFKIECEERPVIEFEKKVQSTVKRGEKVIYTITAKNKGPGTAENVGFADRIPQGLTFSADGTSPECYFSSDAEGPFVACPLGNISQGGSKTAKIAFIVNQDVACGTVIKNTLHGDGTNTDEDWAYAHTTVECPIPLGGDISIEKTGPATVEPGNKITYNLAVKNIGPSLTANVTVTDDIPAGLTFDPVSSTAGCFQTVSQIVCLGVPVAKNQTVSIKLVFAVPQTQQCGSQIFNRAFISSDVEDLEPDNNMSQISTLVNCPSADLEIQKSGPAIIKAGNVLTYMLTVKNFGPQAATNVIVTDPVPTGLTFNASQSTSGCSLQGTNVVCTAASISNNQSKTFKLSFDVPALSQCDSVIYNSASVVSSLLDTNQANNQSQLVTTSVQCPNADLEITKSGPAMVKAGNVIVYTLVAKNFGPDIATNVVVADVIPTGLMFNASQSSAGCVQNGGSILCNNFSLSSGQSKTFKIAFDVPVTTQCDATVINRASVSGSQTDLNPANNQSEVVTTTVTCPNADLEIIKSGPATVEPGKVIKYMLTAKNLGPDIATNVVIADVVPTGLIFNASQSSNGCVLNGDDVLCNNFSLSAGQSKTFTVAFDVPVVTQCDSVIINRASVSGSQTDLNPVNNQSNVITTSVHCPPTDLSIKKKGPAIVNQGGVITYTLAVKNEGQVNATNVVVTDQIPFGLTFNAAQSDLSCMEQNGVISCTIPSLTKGASKNIILSFLISATQSCSEAIINRAQVTSDQVDNDPQDNFSQTTTTVKCAQADVLIKKSGPATVMKGGSVTYTLTAMNNGPDTATNVVISDQIPSGLTFNPVQSSAGCIQNGGVIECAVGTISKSQSKSVTLVFNVPHTFECSSVIYNSASVMAQELDNNHANNQSSVVTTIVQCPTPKQADLSIMKKGPATALPGGLVVYTLQVTNAGPDNATGAVITDQVPANLTFNAAFSDSSCTEAAGTVTCGAFNLGKNQTKSVTVAFAVPFNAQCDSTVYNTAVVSGSQQDPNPLNNQSQTVTTLIDCPKADLSIQKSGPATVTKSGTILYTLTATNAGPGSASGVILSDSIPSGLIFNAAQSDGLCSEQGLTVTCGPLSLSAGHTKNFTLAFTVSSSVQCGAVLYNKATITGTQIDPNQANNLSQTVATTLHCDTPQTADLSIVKTGPASVTKGGTILYTLTATNAGPNTATNVTIADPLPAGVTFNAAQSSANCVLNGANVLCNNFSLSSGASKTVTIAVNVPTTAECNAQIFNAASVSTSQTDPNPLNNQSSTVTTMVKCEVTPTADLSITKTGPATILKGGVISYTLTAMNAGPFSASGVRITDHVPSGLTFSAAQSDASCAQQSASIVCGDFTLSAGQTKSVTLAFTVPSTAQCSSVIQNTASVSSIQTTDPNSANNQSSTVSTTVDCPVPTFSITKTDNRTTAAPGDALSYVITVTNTSAFNATSVSVTDTLPSQVTFVSATDGGTHSNQTVTWSNISLAAGASKVLTVNATVKAGTTNATVLTNTAQVVNGPSATDTTTVQVAEQFGCIEIVKETYDTNNNVISSVAQFTFNLDGTRSVQNDSAGKAKFENVSVGTHTVTETLPSTWTQTSVTPSGGNVTVSAGTVCATVVFKNKQTLIAGTPTFTITKSDGRSDIRPGETLTYSITVTNTSSFQATNITVTDTLPSQVTYSSASDSPAVSGQSLTWSNLTFAAGASRTFTVTVTVQSGAQHGTVLINTAQVQSNTATDTTMVIRDQQPPVYPPHYPPVYPPVQPPLYPPVQPPHYPPVQPPIGKPYPYPVPETGENVASDLYASVENGEEYLTAQTPEESSLATYIAIFATTIVSAVTAAGTMVVKFF